jgi:hypothetical protein
MKRILQLSCVSALLASLGVIGMQGVASAITNEPFTTLAPGFTQTLYATGLNCCGGVAFAPNGDPLFVSGLIYHIDSTTTTTIDGSNVHPVTVVAPAAPLFFGVVNGKNGALYANTSAGVEEIDMSGNVLAGPVGPAGNGLGITVDPQTGNLVYPDAGGDIAWANESLTSTGVFAPGATSDGLIFDPTGNYLFTAQFGAGINEYNRSGALVQNIPNSSSPDGMAFHAGNPNFLVSNNNDGSITRYDFPGGDLTLPPVQSVLASGGFRGDLTQVGSDGCLYATQGGTRFADGTTTGDGSLVQICPGFIPPVGTGPVQGPGYFKTHQSVTTSLLPQSLGTFVVSTWSTAKAVFSGMNCSNSSPQNAIGCLAAELLVAELNSANNAAVPPCLPGAISNANAFLTAIGYTGPTGTYPLTSSQRSSAIADEVPLANANGGSPVC